MSPFRVRVCVRGGGGEVMAGCLVSPWSPYYPTQPTHTRATCSPYATSTASCVIPSTLEAAFDILQTAAVRMQVVSITRPSHACACHNRFFRASVKRKSRHSALVNRFPCNLRTPRERRRCWRHRATLLGHRVYPQPFPGSMPTQPDHMQP